MYADLALEHPAMMSRNRPSQEFTERGRLRHSTGMPLSLTALRTVNQRAIRSAGPRYMPGWEAGAPNLSVAAMNEVFDAVALRPPFRARIDAMSNSVRTVFGDLPRSLRTELSAKANNPILLARQLALLRDTAPEHAEALTHQLSRTAATLMSMVRIRIGRLGTRLTSAPRDSDVSRNIEDAMRRMQAFSTTISNVVEFAATPSLRAAGVNRLLVLGEWGTGKTHSLCDLTNSLTDAGFPVLLCMGQQLPSGFDPLAGVCRVTGLASDSDQLLQSLQRLGRRFRGRALLVIDAINEGDRTAWTSALPMLVRTLRDYPNVALVLSCRRPFDVSMISRSTSKQCAVVHHIGFRNQEFDAQRSFFDFYDIPALSLPLLTEEFSRPLFLQLLCKAITSLSRPTQHRQLKSFASGQRGMTYLLEYFVKQLGTHIEDDLGLTRGLCWKLIKGHSLAPGALPIGIAPAMANRLTDTLDRNDCINIIRDFLRTCHRPQEPELLLQRLVADGLLAEDVRWDDGATREVIRFTYQRFGDHIVARHLMARHLRVESHSTIRRSFHRNRPLGKIFEITPQGNQYVMPGLASAVMLEFPQRVRRHVTDNQEELVSFLPRARQIVEPFRKAFLEGLTWRSNDSFSLQTDRVIDTLLGVCEGTQRNEVIEALFSLETRTGHMYSDHHRLYRWLAEMPMARRDWIWSEYIRRADESATPYRLVIWLETGAAIRANEHAAETFSRLLTLMLTTTVRPLRDRATRALFLVGLRHPEVLGRLTIECLEFNDPYIVERLLAASYGVAMALWADPAGQKLRAMLPAFAKELARKMFVPPAIHGTRHALARSYALGCIAVARRLRPSVIATRHVKYLQPPFDQLLDPFNRDHELTEAQRAEIEPAIHMDFGNYTLGTLVPERRDYDFTDPEYKRVRFQLLARMYELGYRYSIFGRVDQRIGQYAGLDSKEDGKKTDRYGKKYSWIAHFDLTGQRGDQGLLRDEWSDPLRFDADLDPSFPLQAPIWSVQLPAVFDDAPREAVSWLHDGPTPSYGHFLNRRSVDGVRGPWVLMNGYLEQEEEFRRVFTFLRGVLVSPADIEKVRYAFLNVDYPGNQAIPPPAGDHYTFAGEIPWARTFGRSSRRRDGRARRDVERALKGWPGIPSGVRLEIPAYQFSWGPTYSVLNENTGAEVPSPSACASLGLVNHSRSLDLYDRSGRVASLCRGLSENTGRDRSRGQLFYMRRSLVQRYLRTTGQALVWMLWGERNFTVSSGLHQRPDIRGAWATYRHIHRRFRTLGAR